MFRSDEYRGLEPEDVLRLMLRNGVDFTSLDAKEFLSGHFSRVELKRPVHERFDKTGEIVTFPSDEVEVTAETHLGQELDFRVAIEMIGGRRAGKSAFAEKIKEIEFDGGVKPKTLIRGRPEFGIPDSFAEMAPAAASGAKSFKDFAASVKKVDSSWFEESKAIEKSLTKKTISGKEFTSWILDEAETSERRNEVNYDKKQIGKALEPYIDVLDEALSSADGFILSEPRSVTRKGTDEGFSKIPLIGGEKLEGIKVYMGKRDGIIFVFESEGVEGTIEINGADALESLDGFDEFINDALGFDFLDKVGEMVMTAEAAMKVKQVKQAEAAYSSEFGSW